MPREIPEELKTDWPVDVLDKLTDTQLNILRMMKIQGIRLRLPSVMGPKVGTCQAKAYITHNSIEQHIKVKWQARSIKPLISLQMLKIAGEGNTANPYHYAYAKPGEVAKTREANRLKQETKERQVDEEHNKDLDRWTARLEDLIRKHAPQPDFYFILRAFLCAHRSFIVTGVDTLEGTDPCTRT